MDKEKQERNFPGDPVVKTALPLQGAQVQSLVGELTSCMPCRVGVYEGSKINKWLLAVRIKWFQAFSKTETCAKADWDRCSDLRN